VAFLQATKTSHVVDFYPTTIANSPSKWNFWHIKVGDVDHNNPCVVETSMENQKSIVWPFVLKGSSNKVAPSWTCHDCVHSILMKTMRIATCNTMQKIGAFISLHFQILHTSKLLPKG
jgi:hypothetical protein